MDEDFVEFETNSDSIIKSMLLFVSVGFITYMWCFIKKKEDEEIEQNNQNPGKFKKG